MPDSIETYLEDVLCYADLAAKDERSVRAELAEHLHTMVEASPTSTPKEIYAVLSEEFGKPKIVGRAIAAAKGRIRTYFKKRRRRLPIQVGIAVLLGLAVRFAVAQEFHVSGDGAAPLVPRGSRVLVYKLARTFNPGDVVVFRLNPGEYRLGIIQHETGSGGWVVERKNRGVKETLELPMDWIVGRVFLNTR
jgi:hypothetical protein